MHSTPDSDELSLSLLIKAPPQYLLGECGTQVRYVNGQASPAGARHLQPELSHGGGCKGASRHHGAFSRDDLYVELITCAALVPLKYGLPRETLSNLYSLCGKRAGNGFRVGVSAGMLGYGQ